MRHIFRLFSIVCILFSALPAQSSSIPAQPQPLIIRLVQAPLAAKAGLDSPRQGEYAAEVAAAQQTLLQNARSQGLHLQVSRAYHLLFNGLAVTLPPTERDRLAALPGVLAVYPDTQIQVEPAVIAANAAAPEAGIQLPSFVSAVDGTGMRIAIIDSGIDYTHPDLGGCLGPTCKVIDGFDFVNQDANPMDDNGHGTHVAGIAAANGSGMQGVAPGASLLAYKVLNKAGSGYISTVIAALEKAADPDGSPATADAADVVNLSLGGAGFTNDPLSLAVDSAVDLGIVVVAAAGNDGSSYQTLNSPGVAAKAVTVGAVDNSDAVAGFSSRGPVDGGLGLFKPELMAPGVAVRSTVPPAGALGDPSRYRSLSGTSMAAPYVSGAAALLRQSHPAWTAAQVKAALMNSAKKIGGDLFSTGAGRIQLDAASALPILTQPGGLTFGSHFPGDADSRSLTVENVSGAPVDVTVTVQLAPWFDPYYQYTGSAPVSYLTTGSGSLSLAAGESQSITLSLNLPGDAPQGFYFGAVTLSYASGSSSVPVALSVMTGNTPSNPNRLLGQVGGLSQVMKIQGDLAYVGIGPRLVIYSIQDKAHPVQIGQTEPGKGYVVGVEVFDHYAMVSHNGTETEIFDITSPGNIFKVGIYPNKNWYVSNIHVQGHYAYMTALNWLWVMDVSDPADPYLIGNVLLTSTSDYALEMVMDGSMAYISEGYLGVQAVDVTDPTSPQLKGRYNSEGYALSLAVSNHLVYLGDQDYDEEVNPQTWVHRQGGLRILNFSNPGNPVQTGYFDLNTLGYQNMSPEVAVEGSRAYVATNRAGGEQVFILDTSQPSSPKHLANFNGSEWPDSSYQLQVQNGFLYSRMINTRVDIFDLRSVQTPQKVSQITFRIPYVRVLSRQGNFLYLAQPDDLTIYDITDPADPTSRGVCKFPMKNFSTDGQKVVAQGNFVYVAAGSLKVCNVSNPDAPKYVTALQTPGTAVAVEALGEYLYIAEGGSVANAGLSVYRHTGSEFQWVSRLALGQDQINDIAIKGGYAYLTSGGGVRIVNIQDPAAPKVSGFLDYPDKGLQRIAIVGSYAYIPLANGYASRGLLVLDLSNPLNPSGSIVQGSEQLMTITAGGDYAYTSFDNGAIAGIYVWDISNPASPQKITYYPDYCGAMNSAVAGSMFYDASWGCGIQWSNFSPRSMYRITGQVRSTKGIPIDGVYITDSLGNFSITDTNGQYELKNVMVGRNQLTAYRPGCTFAAPRVDYTASSDGPGPDFTADAACLPLVNLYLPAVRH